jgi:hypothetical protein
MKQYLMAVHYVEGAPVPSMEEQQPRFEAVDRFNQKLMASGNWVFGGGLHTPDIATVVDNTGSEIITTDGPFAEAKEHLGGFWVILADDLDQALEFAAEGSKACGGPVEVRPFQDEPSAE